MAKQNKINTAYAAAINKRVPIMLGLIGLMLILFVTAFFTTTYLSNKPSPLADYKSDSSVTVKETSIKWLNENKFAIDEFFLERFYLEDDGNYIEDGSLKYKITLGNKKDQNISGNVIVETYACYSWANQSFKANASIGFKESRSYSCTVDSTFNKRPFFFTNINLKNDIYFVTVFKVTEVYDGNSNNMIYAVEHDYKDLVVTGTGGTSFQ